MYKRGTASFETIAAIFGTILIGTGVAWFVAQNWHQIPSAIKILILLGATAAAYSGGVVLRVREYPQVSKTLLILGALLSTLSIFLIAQIFFTGGSMQGVAWLWLISFAGVFAAAYFLEAYELAGIGALEFIVWVGVQGSAFMQGISYQIILAMPFYILGLALGLLLTKITINGKAGRVLGLLAAIVISSLSNFQGGFESIIAIVSATIFLPIALFLGKSNNREGTFKTCAGLLSSMLILWIALFFIHPGTLQESTFIIFTASAASFALAYHLRSAEVLYLALLELTGGIIMQYGSFADAQTAAPGFLATYLLALGAIVYGLSLLHKATGHEFSRAYGWWTALYLLVFTYLISFQFTLPALWSVQTTAKTPAMLSFFLGLAALASLATGIKESLKKGTCEKKEIVGVLAILALLAVVIGSAGLVASKLGICYLKSCYSYKDQNACQNAQQDIGCYWTDGNCQQKGCYEYNKEPSCQNAPKKLGCRWEKWGSGGGCYSDPDNFCSSHNNNQEGCAQQNVCNWQPEFLGHTNSSVLMSVWALWLFSNIVFIAVILGTVFYGTWQRMPGMVNLGIAFFALEIATRYAGFISDHWGSTSLAMLFISGGIVLIFGGIAVEKWRKKLITQAKGSTSG